MFSLRWAAIFAACLCVISAAPVDDIEAPQPFADEENYRLPTTVKPVNYNITLRPYLLETDASDKRFTFDGETTIEIVPAQITQTVTFHTKNLKYILSECWDKATPATKIQIASNVTNNVTDIITITLATNLSANRSYILHFVYTGTMDDDMHGFYRSSYIDSKNQTKWLGSTQFQTIHARRAFPSFDEPKFKATFDITLIRHKSMKTVSNTRLISSAIHSTDSNYTIDVYKTTPVMSTYLIAFIVSEFNERFNGDFGVLARPEYYAQTEYSFEVGQKILAELDSYLGIKYYEMGNDKMHMAAIPDFSAGAMENWGLLTYRERALLYEEGSTTLSAKQYIAAVVAHEQAHMWFGDLVTCDWWSYTWLNEGFARFFQYFGTAWVETELDLEKQFIVDQIQAVMNMDSTNSTNPLSDENTNTPADVSRMFNSISYNKGASIIRMIKHVIGEDNFRKTLREYLDKHKYTNAIPQNLLDAFKLNWPTTTSAQADNIFWTYTTQVGYPLITVNLGADSKTITFTQKRFLLKEDDGSNKTLLYTVPITYTTNVELDFNSTTPKFILPNSTASHVVTLASNVSYVIANIQETGYYRVNYTEANWHNIHHALLNPNWSGIHELNRAQIVDDLLNLARASVVSYDLALAVLEYLETETNYLPWTAAFNGFNYLAIRLGTDTAHFGSYIRQLTSKAYNMLGFEEKSTDGTLDIYNRAKILAWSCKFGNSDCISKAKSYFNQFKSSNDSKTNPIPVNIRSIVYCVAMREGNNDDLDALFQKYKTETIATEETLKLNSLGCVKDQTLIEKVFNIILSDDVRRQDKSSALTSLYTENNENVSPVFKLVTDKHVQLADAMGGYSAVASVISNIASRFTEESQQNDLKTFNSANKSKFGSSAATLEAAEVTVAENLLWATNKLDTFRTYLSQRSGSATTNAFTAFTLVLVAFVAILFR